MLPTTKESIRHCNFLLEKQKDMIIEMLEDETPITGSDIGSEIECIVDAIFIKLFSITLDDLTANEAVMLKQVIVDMSKLFNGRL